MFKAIRTFLAKKEESKAKEIELKYDLVYEKTFRVIRSVNTPQMRAAARYVNFAIRTLNDYLKVLHHECRHTQQYRSIKKEHLNVVSQITQEVLLMLEHNS